jgi:hypothetical protein
LSSRLFFGVELVDCALDEFGVFELEPRFEQGEGGDVLLFEIAAGGTTVRIWLVAVAT